MVETDNELIRQSCWDGGLAFERLVRRWERPLGALLVKLGGPSSEVDDLRQEVFLRVYESRNRYKAKGAFSTWLYRIALNLVRDRARRKAARTPKGPVVHLQVSSDPGRELTRQEIGQAVGEALETLPESLREALVLKHYGELTFDGVAKVLNEPVTTIKSRIHRALEQLGSELRRRGLDEGVA